MPKMLKLSALFATGLAALQCASVEQASRNDRSVPESRMVRSDAHAELLMLGLNEAIAIDSPADIKKILVGDLQTVRVIVRTVRRVVLVGASVGRTNIIFYDGNNHQILLLDVSVLPQITRPELGVLQQATRNATVLI
jgi:Flp pilus assembly secretin CpaC